MNLPEYLKVCPVCQGKGKYEQKYNAGCGMGHIQGPCDYCDVDYLYDGVGVLYTDNKRIPKSVYEHLKNMSLVENG